MIEKIESGHMTYWRRNGGLEKKKEKGFQKMFVKKPRRQHCKRLKRTVPTLILKEQR